MFGIISLVNILFGQIIDCSGEAIATIFLTGKDVPDIIPPEYFYYH